MGTVVITYLTAEGTEIKHQLDDETKRIDLSARGIATIDLSPLAACKNLEQLFLHNNRLKGVDLSPLGGCLNLQVLDISHNEISALNLSELALNVQIQEISLQFNVLRILSLDIIDHWSGLRMLDLAGNPLTEIELTPLSSCEKLEWLYLSGIPLENVNLSALSKCKNLRRVYLSHCRLVTFDFGICRQMRDLEILRLDNNSLTDVDFSPLKACRELRILLVDRNVLLHDVSVDITPLFSCRNLEQLSFDSNVTLTASPSLMQVSGKIPGIQTVATRIIWTDERIKFTARHGKVIIIGEPMAGKTELAHALLRESGESVPESEADDRTVGVEIHTIAESQGINRYFFHIWDFAGQKYYGQVHRLFLSSDALYMFVFKPQPIGQIGLDRWYELFDMCTEEKGYFALVRTFLDDPELSEVWNGIQSEFEASLVDCAGHSNPRVLYEVFEVDSLEPAHGLQNLLSSLRPLMEKASPLASPAVQGWEEVWNAVRRLQLATQEDDLNILTQDEIYDKIKEHVTQLDEGILYTVLTRMHSHGLLTFSPLLYRKGVERRIPNPRSNLVLLSADLASKVLTMLHGEARTSDNPGSLTLKQIDEFRRNGYSCMIPFSRRQDMQVSFTGTAVSRLLDFVLHSGIGLAWSGGIILPESIEKRPPRVDLEWFKYLGITCHQIEGTIHESLDLLLPRLIRTMKLNPVVTWRRGGLFETLDEQYETEVLFKIELERALERNGRRGVRLHVMARTNSPNERAAAGHSILVLGRRLNASLRTTVYDSEWGLYEPRIASLNVYLGCPVCTKPLDTTLSDEILCREHGIPDTEVLKADREVSLGLIPVTSDSKTSSSQISEILGNVGSDLIAGTIVAFLLLVGNLIGLNETYSWFLMVSLFGMLFILVALFMKRRGGLGR